MLLWRIGWKKLNHSSMELKLTRSLKRGLSRTGAQQQCLDSTPSSSLTLQPHNGNIDQLATNLKDASKGVVVDTTLSDYANYWNQFKEFVVTIDRAKSPSEVDVLLPNIPVDFPT
ncbi:hypothetical protein L210DRAFT_1032614 [Boletus edulis BED1]|uniref:Uncharacterized protein n=1 Tax=Boletus edulis BED1 TaxID=1328754 RepID=A0AAD4C8E7_BOLED|nr:hypothetical protein L210DRAFT_1032614 [Boletus edulis BED1]